MKRIALLIFMGFLIVACDSRVIDPVEEQPYDPDAKEISLKIHVPPKSISTYAEEPASTAENKIDTIFVVLYQGATPIDTSKFFGTTFPNDIETVNDSTVRVGYLVDNIPSGARVKVFANHLNPVKIGPSPLNNEIPLPSPQNYFYMSGDSTLTLTGTYYSGEVHVLRNVAKLRIHVTKNSVVIPYDLEIDYNNIKIQILNATDSTTAVTKTPIDGLGIGYIDYPEHTNTTLKKGVFDAVNGGMLDSIYLYENYRNNYFSPSDLTTQIRISVPTRSQSEGNVWKTAVYTYPIHTTLTGYGVLRNHIYTLDLKVAGQDPAPLITMDVKPWDDVPIDGSIHGVNLTLDKSEIEFDSNGEATINFCTDAQAIYFDFSEFNQSNPTTKLGGLIKAVGIDTSLTNAGGFPLAPDGFKDAQIIVDQQHCGSFGFKINPSDFPGFPNVNFSGKICIRAGNIVKCLTFPARLTYDAHFIVGDPILNGETFIKADVSASWIEVSTARLYTTAAGSSYPLGGVGTGSPAPLYLHLDENLSTSNTSRTGSVTLTNSAGVQKTINITQLPAIYVGRFGYNNMSSIDDSIYTAYLYTEQLKEFGTTKPFYSSSTSAPILPNNALYNGRYSPINMTQVFDATYYMNESFDYQSAVYEAINYCAYKNRPTPANTTGALSQSDIKWYLPAQAQLMGMWISNEYYKDFTTSNFVSTSGGSSTYPDIFWSSTHNPGHPPYSPTQAQYVDFRYGNVGHYERAQQNWVRCVRDGDAPSPSSQMIERDVVLGIELPEIYFNRGLPPSITTVTDKVHIPPYNENDPANKEIYMQLRVAKYDLDDGALVAFNPNICDNYSHSDEAGYPPFSFWRLPTQRELQAIWILQHEIKSLVPSFNLLADEYYWSGTYAASTFNSSTSTYSSVWTVFGNGSRAQIGGAGNSPHQLYTTPLRVRCVLQY